MSYKLIFIIFSIFVFNIISKVQILQEYGISSFFPGISGFAIFFLTGSPDQNPHPTLILEKTSQMIKQTIATWQE